MAANGEKMFLGDALVSGADFGVLAVLLVGMVGVGFYFRRRQTSTHEFFLGGRTVPGWAAALSFVATEVSAVTIISVPATAYRENWEYLQFFVGIRGRADRDRHVCSFRRSTNSTAHPFINFWRTGSGGGPRWPRRFSFL
jgi:hypothetical protein